MIRVLIADDHAIVREGLKRILADDSSVETIAEAADGQEAARLVRLHKPDVVLLDISMPGRSGGSSGRHRRHRRGSSSSASAGGAVVTTTTAATAAGGDG